MFGINFEFVKADRSCFQSDLLEVFSPQKEVLEHFDFDLVHFAHPSNRVSAIPMLKILKLQDHKMINFIYTNRFTRSACFFSNFIFKSVIVTSKRMLNNFLEKQIPREKLG
jgi:hypothetical protein